MAEQAETSSVIEVENLGRRFGKRQVLSRINLKIFRGEIFGVVGPDGAGKTTLLQLLAAILEPTGGQCRTLGFDTIREAKQIVGRIGYMSQGFTLYDRLSVDENLRFAAQIRGVTGEDWRIRRSRLLQMAGLTAFPDRRADHLSGGMRKKLALCTNLIHEPPLLLLDEPSLGVDPLSRYELWNMLREFRGAEKTTIVVATSYMDEALFCDRLAFLSDGRLLAVGTPAQLHAQSGNAVYEIITESPDNAEQVLTTRHDVIAVQRLPDRLRIQIDLSAPTGEDEIVSLSQLGEARRVVPSLEDAFVFLSRQPGRSPDRHVLPREAKQYDSERGIEASQVTFRFGRFVALNRVSLTVPSGEVFGFLGPNGAGKTTFIRALCGLLSPQTGTISVAGIDVLRHRRRLRHRIGYMSQRFSLYPDLTVGENLEFFAGAYGLVGGQKSDAMAWASEMVGLAGLHERIVAEVSGAVRQRLALACSIMHRPAVLFLDEPTSGVDPSSRHRFWRLIHVLAGSGMTVLITTHYLQEATYCHRFGLMFEGRLIAVGTLETLRTAFPETPPNTVEDLFMAYMKREQKHFEAPARGTTP